jgi:hypothetical protein
MINHLRTLLLNSAPNEDDFSEPVSPEFVPVSLLSCEHAVQRALVPANFPNRTRNYLATIISSLSSAHPMHRIVRALDPRMLITTNIDDTPLFPTRHVSGSYAPIVFYGDLAAKPDIGMFSAEWRITSAGNASISVIDKNRLTRTEHSVTIPLGSDVSETFALGDSGVSFRVVGAESVAAFDLVLKVTQPILFPISDVVSVLRSNDNVSQVFDLQDRKAGTSLMNDFLNSRNPVTAIAAVAIAYTAHISERVYS